MSDHLPECPLLEPCDDEVPEHGYCSMQHGVFCIHCHQWCICDELRACEQRVERRIDFMLAKANDYGERTGYAAALDAARYAVAALLDEFPNPDFQIANSAVHTALAAIDALRVQPAERAEDNLRGES